ncbi:C4-dicarboxylate TRAP transporter substrate-binding protein [Tessaracoccus terricola]
MRIKKRTCIVAAGLAASVALLGACSNESAGGGGEDVEGDVVTIELGFENTMEEPVGQAVQYWADQLEEQSGGQMKLDLYPNSALGSKPELIDQMVAGEGVITIADGGFYAEFGAPDMGILYGPFFFQSWDEVWNLVESDWYAEQSELLADKGLTLLASNWIYGDRHLMTTKEVHTPADIAGMNIRLANSKVFVEGFNAIGANAVAMDLGDVYTGLQTGVVEGVENPMSTLYGQSFQEVAPYLLKTSHIRNFTTWVTSTDFLDTLTDEQRELLISTAEEAGLHNNELAEAADSEYQRMLEDDGVTVSEVTDEERQQWEDAAQGFYDLGDELGWSEGLFDTVQEAKSK